MHDVSDEVTRKVIIARATAMMLFAAAYVVAVADMGRRAGPPPWQRQYAR